MQCYGRVNRSLNLRTSSINIGVVGMIKTKNYWPQRGYIICATPRSGSTLLCKILRETHLVGYPEEALTSAYLQQIQPGLEISRVELLQQLPTAYATPNGIFGIKIMWPQVAQIVTSCHVLPGCQGLNAHEIFQHFFPGLRYIWIRRHDQEQQAVSLAIAQQTQKWSSKHAQTGSDPVFNFYQIYDGYSASVYFDQQWQLFFKEHQLQPLELYYEDLIQDFTGETRRILDYLEVEYPADFQVTQAPLKKQSGNLNQQWLQHYRQLRSTIPYCHYVSIQEIQDLLKAGEFQQILTIAHYFPSDSPFYYVVKIISFQVKLSIVQDIVGAEQDLEAAIQHKPTQPDAYAHRALLRCHQGHFQDAKLDIATAEAKLKALKTPDESGVDLLIQKAKQTLAQESQL